MSDAVVAVSYKSALCVSTLLSLFCGRVSTFCRACWSRSCALRSPVRLSALCVPPSLSAVVLVSPRTAHWPPLCPCSRPRPLFRTTHGTAHASTAVAALSAHDRASAAATCDDDLRSHGHTSRYKIPQTAVRATQQRGVLCRRGGAQLTDPPRCCLLCAVRCPGSARSPLCVVRCPVCLVCATDSALPSRASYLGCYSDRADILHRALPLLQEISEAMTVPMCLGQCASLGFEFAGLEYKHECYCGSRPPPYEKLEESACTTVCGGGGEGFCGGALSLSVYRQPVTRPTFDSDRPLLCLVMILKNEAHTVANTLRTVVHHIDCWVILDTGSDDGTPQVITRFFQDNPGRAAGGKAADAGSSGGTAEAKPVPGRLFSEPFIDYGATRNRVLVLAKETFNPVFTLMLSADEQVLNAGDLRSFLEAVRYARGTQHGAYPVVMNTGLKFDSIRVARVDAGWRYKARVHEYLAPPTGPYVGLFRPSALPSPPDAQSPVALAPPGPNALPGREILVAFNATDGPRRFASQFFIRRILEEDLARNPNDTRSIYYLARTNSGVGNHSQAYYYYDLLAKRSKWDEEVYHGMVMRALETKHLSSPPESFTWQHRQTMLLDAFAFKPQNMDALHALAQDHFDSGRFQLAFLFALRAVQLPIPAGLAAIENVLLRPTKFLYDYEGQRLLGFAARQIEEWEACVRAFRAVLAVQKDDTIVKDRIKLCEEKMAEQGKFTQPLIHPEPLGAARISEVPGVAGGGAALRNREAGAGAEASLSEGDGAQNPPTPKLSIPGSWDPNASNAAAAADPAAALKHAARRRSRAGAGAGAGADGSPASDPDDAAADLSLRHQVVNARSPDLDLNNPELAAVIAANAARRRVDHLRHEHSLVETTEKGTVRVELTIVNLVLSGVILGCAVIAIRAMRQRRHADRKVKV